MDNGNSYAIPSPKTKLTHKIYRIMESKRSEVPFRMKHLYFADIQYFSKNEPGLLWVLLCNGNMGGNKTKRLMT